MFITNDSLSSRECFASEQKIPDTQNLKKRIGEVWEEIQQKKEAYLSHKSSPFSQNLTQFFTPEEEWVDFILHVTGDLKISLPSMIRLREEFKTVEKAQISYLALQALVSGNKGCSVKVHFVWEALFSQTLISLKLKQLGLVKSFFAFLVQETSIEEATLFLKTVMNTLCPSLKSPFLFGCLELISREEFFLKNGGLLCLIESLTDGNLETQEIEKMFEWLNGSEKLIFLQKCVKEKPAPFKKRVWQALLNKKLPHNERLLSISLLKDPELQNEAILFYKSDFFKELIKDEGIYNQVYSIVLKSSFDKEKLSSLHKIYNAKCSSLKNERGKAALEKVSGKGVTSPALIEEILDDIDAQLINDSNLWRAILEKLLNKSPEPLKKKAWLIWLKSYSTLVNDKIYPKLWVDAIKLADSLDLFFESHVLNVLGSLKNKADLLSFYKEINHAPKKTVEHFYALIEANQTYLKKGHNLPLESILYLSSESLKSPKPNLGFELLTTFVQAKHEDLKEINSWLLFHLEGSGFKKDTVPYVLSFIEFLIEFSRKEEKFFDDLKLAEALIKKGKEFEGLALRVSFKALFKATNEYAQKRVGLKQLETCFDLIIKLIPKSSDKDYLMLLERENILGFQNLYHNSFEKKWVTFFEEMMLRGFKLQSCFIPLSATFWKLISPHNEKKGVEYSLEMFSKVLSDLINDNSIPLEEKCERFKNVSFTLLSVFQQKVTYKLDKNGRVASLRPIDLCTKWLCDEAKKYQSFEFVIYRMICDFVTDPIFIEEFNKTGIHDELKIVFIETISNLKNPSHFETLEVQDFLKAFRNMISLTFEEDFFDQLDAEGFLYESIAILAPSLFKIHLLVQEGHKKIKEDQKAFFTPLFKEFFIKASEIIENTNDFNLQKLIWKCAITFSVNLENEVEDDDLNDSFNLLMNWIHKILLKKVVTIQGTRSILAKDFAEVINLVDFGASKLHLLEFFIAESVEKLISILLEMAYLQINCRKFKEKKQIVLEILEWANCQSLTYLQQYQLILLAIDAETENFVSEMMICGEPNPVKILGEGVGYRNEDPELFRSATASLISYALKRAQEEESLDWLCLMSELLVVSLSKPFQNKQNCLSWIRFFSSLMNEMKDYHWKDVQSYNILNKVFFSLHNKPVGPYEERLIWENINSFEELIGTNDEAIKTKVRKEINGIIRSVFEAWGDNGKYLSCMNEEKKQDALDEVKKFLLDCELKNYLTIPEIRGWQEKLNQLFPK